MKTKRKESSLFDDAFDLLKLLDPNTRREIEANNQRKDYGFMETALMQQDLTEKSKNQFPPGRSPKDRRKDSEKCQDVGTLKSLGFNRVDAVVGEIFHESAEMVRRRRIILKAVRSNPEKYADLVKRIDSGQTSIEYAARMIENGERKLKPSPALPEGEYSLIYLDPPWKYDLELSGAPDYKTMTLDELKKIKIPAYKNCVMFMWCTNPKLEEGLALMKHWGMTYKTNIVWIKQKDNKLQVGTGYYVRGAHELLLIAIKGKPGLPAEEDRIPSVVSAPVTRHSEKPPIFKKIIHQLYARTTKLEMFARNIRENHNSTWSYWGDEQEDKE